MGVLISPWKSSSTAAQFHEQITTTQQFEFEAFRKSFPMGNGVPEEVSLPKVSGHAHAAHGICLINTEISPEMNFTYGRSRHVTDITFCINKKSCCN